MTSPSAPGFSLIELLTVVSIIAILAAIAVPPYAAYVQRGRLVDAITRLADARSRMEQYFLDRRSYVDDDGRCGVPPSAATSADAFELRCDATASTYTYTATGLATHGMAGFAYTIDQSGTKATLSVPSGWRAHADCWTIRSDGLCV
ncbi:MAG TPA: type IV pilin protein [Casimicrobiaceae bacterium]|nr:type IV pilin protein [Casimicrobiaceae bacterium]